MVPGNLPSQLEILSTGQTYYETLPAWHLGPIEMSRHRGLPVRVTTIKPTVAVHMVSSLSD